MDFNTRVGVISSWEPAFELALRVVGLTWQVNMTKSISNGENNMKVDKVEECFWRKVKVPYT